MSSGRHHNENRDELNSEDRENTGVPVPWEGWGTGELSTHWLGLAPKVSRRRTAEVWPRSADRKSAVCPAEFSPSTWTTEGQKADCVRSRFLADFPATKQHTAHVELNMYPRLTVDFCSSSL